MRNDPAELSPETQARVIAEGWKTLAAERRIDLRDRFAMAAITGMLAARPSAGLTDAHEMAAGAYIIADVMLKASGRDA